MGDGAPLTVSGAVLGARRRFAEAGLETPELDARVLVGHALGLDRVGMISDGNRPLTPEEGARIDALVVRRLAREPVGRILGYREFWGLRFALGPETLEPRPDSEAIVEAALDAVSAGPGRAARMRIADLGTGSGCLLVALLSELPSAFGVGIDIGPGAVRVARENAVANGVADRAGFVLSHWSDALSGGFDVVVSNPPYITSEECAVLPREVAGFDPAAALDGGADGLDSYRAILDDVARVLAPSGTLVLELGAGQCEAVSRLARDRGLLPGEARRDLAGIDRALAITVSCA